MYRYSIQVRDASSAWFGIPNLEVKDEFFGAPLWQIDGAQISDVRELLISRLQRIVLYTTNLELNDLESYALLFRNAYALGIENVKICGCALRDGGEPAAAKIKEIAKIGGAYGIRVLMEPKAKHPGSQLSTYALARSENTGLIFNPLDYVKMGKNPYLGVLYKNRFKSDVAFLRITDGLYGEGAPVMVEKGNGEIKECVSTLLSRNYTGYFSFIPYLPNVPMDKVIQAFQNTLKQM